MRIKDKFESSNLGDFQCLYPLRRGLIIKHDLLMDKYDALYARSREVYEETTQGGHAYYKKPKGENQENEKPSDKKADKQATE
jgi:hypothetical protein